MILYYGQCIEAPGYMKVGITSSLPKRVEDLCKPKDLRLMPSVPEWHAGQKTCTSNYMLPDGWPTRVFVEMAFECPSMDIAAELVYRILQEFCLPEHRGMIQ